MEITPLSLLVLPAAFVLGWLIARLLITEKGKHSLLIMACVVVCNIVLHFIWSDVATLCTFLVLSTTVPLLLGFFSGVAYYISRKESRLYPSQSTTS